MTTIRPHPLPAIVLALVAAMSGCSTQGEPGVALSGTITYKGTPLTDGMITFAPDKNIRSRTAASRIVNGRYTIARDDGPSPGRFQVTILAYDPTATADAEGRRPTLPGKYGWDGNLFVEVPRRKSHEFLFDLD